MSKQLNKFAKGIVTFEIISSAINVVGVIPVSANGIEKYLKENITLNGEGDKLIEPETPENSDQNNQTINTGIVTATRLNIRSGYGTKYPLIGSLKNGEKVEIVESQNGGHKIRYNGGYGYITGEYIK